MDYVSETIGNLMVIRTYLRWMTKIEHVEIIACMDNVINKYITIMTHHYNSQHQYEQDDYDELFNLYMNVAHICATLVKMSIYEYKSTIMAVKILRVLSYIIVYKNIVINYITYTDKCIKYNKMTSDFLESCVVYLIEVLNTNKRVSIKHTVVTSSIDVIENITKKMLMF